MQTVWDPVDAMMECYDDYAASLAFLEEEYNAGNLTLDERDEGIADAIDTLEVCRQDVNDQQDNPRPVDPTDE